MFKKKLKQAIRRLQLYVKYYSLLPSPKKAPCIVFMLNNAMMHGGLLDRIKGIITASVIAENTGYPLKIYVDKNSFNLFKFLIPVNSAVVAADEDISYSIWNSQPVLIYNLSRITKEEIVYLLRKKKNQYHLYCNLDLLKQFYPGEPPAGLNWLWKERFNSLFRFDGYFINYAAGGFGTATDICGIHLRFVSLMGDFKEVTDNALPDDEKNRLAEKCIRHIKNIMEAGHHEKYLVVSDSVYFLQTLKGCLGETAFGEKLVILGGPVAHIDLDHSEEVLQKTILDFYLLSRCSKVYQVQGPKMYNSQFCRYAAVLGNAPYQVDKI